jgi:hypothetical protein
MIALVTSAGQRHDGLGLAPVMDRIQIRRRDPRHRPRPGQVLADKAYSSKAIRADLRRRGITATIPQPADQIRNRKARGASGGRPPAFDKVAYRRRGVIAKSYLRRPRGAWSSSERVS